MKILVIGYGSIAKKHKAAMDSVDSSSEWFALRSRPDAESIDGVTSVFSWNDIADLDFILISNPTSKHLETLIKAADLGKPMMIEKPLFHELSKEAEELVQQIKESDIPTYVACNLRFHPVIQFLKRTIKKDDVIEVNAYCGSYLPDWRPNADYRDVYSARKELGGGVHLDLIHEIDYLCYLMGVPKNVQSYVRQKSTLEINSPDVAHYILEYPSASAFVTLNYYRQRPKRQLEIVMTNDTWTADLISGKVVNQTNDTVFSEPFEIQTTYKLQMQHMVDVVLGKATSMNMITEGYRTLRYCMS